MKEEIMGGPQILVSFDPDLNKYVASVVGVPALVGISRFDYEAVEIVKRFLQNLL